MSKEGITEECPPPPSYFRCFDDAGATDIAPPVLDKGMTPRGVQSELYGGSIDLLNNISFDQTKDYASALKIKLNRILAKAKELVGTLAKADKEEVILSAMRAELEQFHLLLGEYREHEAIEKMIIAREEEITLLRSLYEESEEVLKSVV